ncbi:hypothetical protein HZA73_04255 [candidate division TA06 bacterium]|nr:hypothetical protein [candidate division TA06 bacterium]
MIKRITIILISFFAFISIAGLNGQEKKQYKYADEGLKEKSGHRLLKESWKKVYTGDIIDRSCKIVIGTVIDVKDTPDDDYYFHQATIKVERTLMGDTTEKEIIVKYIYPVGMSKERFLRSRNWENYIRKVVKMDPQEYLIKLNKGELGVPGQSIEPNFSFTKSERVLLYLSDIPANIHSFYDGTYDDVTGLYWGLADFFPYTEEKFYELQHCDGYYEVSKYRITEGNLVHRDYVPRKDAAPLDSVIKTIVKKVKDNNNRGIR